MSSVMIVAAVHGSPRTTRLCDLLCRVTVAQWSETVMLLLLLLAVLVVRPSHARPQQAEGRDLVLEAMVMRTHNHR